jgi:protein arginine N-methyltransferase 1
VRKSASGALRFVFRSLKNAVRSNRFARNLLYDIENTEEFSNLLEHERMIGDAVRVDAYHEAIGRHVKAGDTVVDLGTGTGILAMFASAQQPRTVYAIDHSDFIRVAQRIAEHNKRDRITFIQANSRDFAPGERVDVILHEQIGDDLFDENMVENLLDLKRRVLKESGIIVPGRFELYFEPVTMKPGLRTPFLWEQRVHGVDFSTLRSDPELHRYKSSEYERPFITPGTVERFLCEPAPALTFDLNTMQAADELPRLIAQSRTVVHAGELDGFCLYFRVIFDSEVGFSTSPLAPLTHWGNRLFRTPPMRLQPGATLSYRVELDDLIDSRRWRVLVDQPS